MDQIEKVTQRNASYAEETASAAAELSGQAAHLKRLMARFRLRTREAREAGPDHWAEPELPLDGDDFTRF